MGSKRILGNVKDKDLSRYQSNLRAYLRSYRQTEKIYREELCKRLGCAMTTLDKYEHKELVSSPIFNLQSLQPFADLRNMDLDVFVSVIVGKCNEEGETNAFVREMTQKIDKLDANNQYQISKLLNKSPKEITEFLDLIDPYLNKKPQERQIIKAFIECKDVIVKSINKLISRLLLEDK